MRVIHWSVTFNSLSQTFLYDYFVTMAAEGIDTWVATENRINAELFPFDNVIELPKINYHRVGPIANRVQRMLGLRDPLRTYAAERFAQWLRPYAPDIIHVHMGDQGRRLVWAAETLGVPIVVSYYGRDGGSGLEDPRRAADCRQVAARASAFTAVSEHLRQRLLTHGFPEDKSSVVRLGVVPERFPYRRELEPSEGLRVLSVGRLTEKKGHEYLIRAAHRLRGTIPGLQVRIVGGGPLEDSLKGLVAELGLGGIVELLGAQPRSVVEESTRWADIFALASVTASDGDIEGTPTAIIEAEFSGIPIVSTVHAGIPESIPPENRHLLVPERNVDALAAAIVYLHEHRGEWNAIRECARDWVNERYEVHINVQEILDIYNRLMAQEHA